MSNANKPVYAAQLSSTYSAPGLTLREHFAGLAMQGMLSDPHAANPPDALARAIAILSEKMALNLLNGKDEAAAALREAREAILSQIGGGL